MVLKQVLCVGVCLLMTLTTSFAVDLQGMMTVNVTSDTAANAKNKAFDQARRHIITDVLRQYADEGALISAVSDAKSSDLMPLIASSSIDGEQLSDTTYTANIKMTIDEDVARVWLSDNGIQNWLNGGASADAFVVQVDMTHGIADWVGLQRVARAKKIDLNTKMLSSVSARLELPTSVRNTFVSSVREAGWHVENKDGVLRISK